MSTDFQQLSCKSVVCLCVFVYSICSHTSYSIFIAFISFIFAIWPKALVIGVRKCGTRALLEMLYLHPRIQKAAGEVHFFDRDENYWKGLEWYRKKMPHSFRGQITIEKSPSYFVTPEVSCYFVVLINIHALTENYGTNILISISSMDADKPNSQHEFFENDKNKCGDFIYEI